MWTCRVEQEPHPLVEGGRDAPQHVARPLLVLPLLLFVAVVLLLVLGFGGVTVIVGLVLLSKLIIVKAAPKKQC